MEILTTLMPLFSAIIAFCSVFAGLGFVFKLLIEPVQADIESLKQGQKELNQKIDQLIAKQN